jgi:hypothetical protein
VPFETETEIGYINRNGDWGWRGPYVETRLGYDLRSNVQRGGWWNRQPLKLHLFSKKEKAHTPMGKPNWLREECRIHAARYFNQRVCQGMSQMQ